MGRSVLLLALMVGIIYLGINTRLQNRMMLLPHIQIKQMIEKETENVSDFALRNAVRNSVSLGLQTQSGSIRRFTQHFTDYAIGNSILDSIQYVFTGTGTEYRAITYVRGELQGMEVSHVGEIAFDFPMISLVGKPDVFYLEMDQPQFNPSPHFNHVIDTSGNNNHGLFYGDVSTRPMGQGANGWKCASFGSNGGWITFPGNRTTEVSTNFSIISFAKIRETSNVSTVVWIPSDPFDTNLSHTGAGGVFRPGQNLRYKPTAGIWFSNGQMHFSTVMTNYEQLIVSKPFVPRGRWPHNRDRWVFLGLTYAPGVIKAYIDGVLVGTAIGNLPLPAIRSIHGFTLGRKDIRVLGPGGHSEYMYMFGLLDQVGMYRRTLTDDEMNMVYSEILSPTRLKYIKD